MKAAAIVMILPFLVLGQTDGNLDVITLDGRNCPLEGDATSPDVKDLNRLKNRYHSPVASDIDPTVTLTAMVAPGDDETRFDSEIGRDGHRLRAQGVGRQQGVVQLPRLRGRPARHAHPR